MAVLQVWGWLRATDAEFAGLVVFFLSPCTLGQRLFQNLLLQIQNMENPNEELALDEAALV